MNRLIPLAAIAALSGCAAYAPLPGPYASPPVYGTVTSSSSATVQLALGGSAQINGLNVHPLSVVEDSRCRPTVQCVWAGRLRVLVALDGAGLHEQRTVELGKPQQTPVGWLTLTGGSPIPATLLTVTVTR